MKQHGVLSGGVLPPKPCSCTAQKCSVSDRHAQPRWQHAAAWFLTCMGTGPRCYRAALHLLAQHCSARAPPPTLAAQHTCASAAWRLLSASSLLSSCWSRISLSLCRLSRTTWPCRSSMLEPAALPLREPHSSAPGLLHSAPALLLPADAACWTTFSCRQGGEEQSEVFGGPAPQEARQTGPVCAD